MKGIEHALNAMMPGGDYNTTVFGCDPGPEHSAVVLIRVGKRPTGLYGAVLDGAWYLPNNLLSDMAAGVWFGQGCMWRSLMGGAFLASEKCGQQDCAPGEETFETAAMYGEIRQLFRPMPTYAMRSSVWRHALTGFGNAKAGAVYNEEVLFFEPTGGGTDKYKGVKAQPGPLWKLHEAGAGGNAEHLKDALGAALGLVMLRFRSGIDPEA